jgi:hypothetical protein
MTARLWGNIRTPQSQKQKKYEADGTNWAGVSGDDLLRICTSAHVRMTCVVAPAGRVACQPLTAVVVCLARPPWAALTARCCLPQDGKD